MSSKLTRLRHCQQAEFCQALYNSRQPCIDGRPVLPVDVLPGHKSGGPKPFKAGIQLLAAGTEVRVGAARQEACFFLMLWSAMQVPVVDTGKVKKLFRKAEKLVELDSRSVAV